MSESYASNPALALALRRGRLSDQLLADSLKPRNVGGHAGGLAQMGTALIGGVMAGLDDRRIDRLIREDRETADAQIAALYGRGPAPAAPGGPAPVTPGSLPPPIPNPEMTGQPAPAGGTAMPVAAPAQPPAQMPEPPAPRMVRLANGQEINLDVLQRLEASPNQSVRLAAAGARRSIDDDRAERRFQEQMTLQREAAARATASAGRESFGQPTEMTDASGQRVMVQVGNRGTIRPVQGYSAPPAAPRPITMAPGQALVDPATGQIISQMPQPPAEPRQSDIERRIDLMVQNGVPREMAVGLSTGQFETRQDPQDGTITIIDRSNGRVLFGPNAGRIIGQPAAPAAPAEPGAPGAPAGPGAPGNVDFRGATGAPGLVAETANFVADLFGGRNLPAPQVAAGAQALRNLDTRTRMFLQSAIPGRPSNYLMEMIGGLTVSPAEIRLGPERATERVQQTTRFLEQTVRELEEIAGGQGTGRFTRQDIGEANRVLVSLRPLLNDYRTLESAMTRQPERAPPQPRRGTLGNRAAPAPAGVDPQLWNVMTPEERALWQN
jgi:hypothetical protein